MFISRAAPAKICKQADNTGADSSRHDPNKQVVSKIENWHNLMLRPVALLFDRWDHNFVPKP